MRVIAVAMLGAQAAAAAAAASTFSISPIRIELASSKATAVLVVRNQNDAPVVVQARPFAWSQAHGEDQLSDTHDVLVTPPIFTLPPQGEQVLRIALRTHPDATHELDYRLVLDEVLPDKPADFTGLRVALRVTLPVFVAAQTRALPELTWHHSWLADGGLHLEASNSGSAHIQVRDLDVTSTEHADDRFHTDSARYILPGSSVSWQLRPDAPVARANHLVIRGHSDAGDFTVASAAEVY